jgi:hypothetical protein
MKTTWTRPECTEIKMDAEIGSYQEDREWEPRFEGARCGQELAAAEQPSLLAD